MITKQQVLDALANPPKHLPGLFGPLSEAQKVSFAAHWRPRLLKRGLSAAEVDAEIRQFCEEHGKIDTRLQRVVVALDLGWQRRYDFRDLYDRAGDPDPNISVSVIKDLATIVSEELGEPFDEITTAIAEAVRRR